MGPELVQHPLARADGSTLLADDLFAVIASVNGPVDVQRRDELEEEAAIEINLRPSSGTAGPRERWLETVLQSVFRSILLVHMHPRTLFQITLQIIKEPPTKLRRAARDIAVLPTLLNASFAAFVDAGLPLGTTMSAILAAVRQNGEIVLQPQDRDIASCTSIHAMAFNKHGEQQMDESSGNFDLETWELVVDTAQQACAAAIAHEGEDAFMANGGVTGEPWLRQALQNQIEATNVWRGEQT